MQIGKVSAAKSGLRPSRPSGADFITQPNISTKQIASDRKAFVFAKNKEVWTWGRLTSEVDRLASGLIGLGIQQGDRVALHMANLPEFVVAYLACFQVGAIAAPLNTRLKKAELEPLLRRLRPSLYIGQSALYTQIASVDESILTANRRFVVAGPVNDRRAQPWLNLLGTIDSAPVRRTADIDAPAVLLATSGTTNQPKFVTHMFATLRETAQSFIHWDLDINQTGAIAVPMVHVSGCLTTLACLWSDVPFVLFERFDPDGVLDGIEFQRCTWIGGLRLRQMVSSAVSFIWALASWAANALIPAEITGLWAAKFGHCLKIDSGCNLWTMQRHPMEEVTAAFVAKVPFTPTERS